MANDIKLLKAAENTNELSGLIGSTAYTTCFSIGIIILLASCVAYWVSNKSRNGQGEFTGKNLLVGVLLSGLLFAPLTWTSATNEVLAVDQQSIDFRNLDSTSSTN